MRERFSEETLSDRTLLTIKWVNSALEDYRSSGYRASIRQLFYHGVSRNIIKNDKRSYQNLIEVITSGRMAGLIDWDLIVDRNRQIDRLQIWDSAGDFASDMIDKFRIDKWADQPNYVEVFVEKAALEGIILPVCRSLQVPFLSCRGFASSSVAYETGKRLQERFHRGKQIHILALFDHDASGMSMLDDLRRRLNLFAQSPVNVHRIALNMDQVIRYNLPENALKATDSRSETYRRIYGDSSWELDGIPMKDLAELVRSSVLNFRNESIWDESCETEEEQREELSEGLSDLIDS